VSTNEEIGRRPLVLLAILFEGGLGVIAWLIGWWTGIPTWETIHWQGRDFVWGIAGSLPMLLIFWACLRWPWGPLQAIKRFSERIIRPLFRPCTVLDLAVISLVAGIGEEMLFRGFLQTFFCQHMETWLGVVLASLAFGLMHPFSAIYVVLATGVGIYLGWLFLLTENLLVVILIHGLYDFVALVFITRWPLGQEKIDNNIPKPEISFEDPTHEPSI
jgi:membrane protease YdiL (CAAX protease family)